MLSSFIQRTDGFCRTLKEIRDAIPPHLFQRRLGLGLAYLLRDFMMAAAIGYLGTFIDPVFIAACQGAATYSQMVGFEVARWAAWGV
jgi:hypothetical protein